jgi:hypothetical protein
MGECRSTADRYANRPELAFMRRAYGANAAQMLTHRDGRSRELIATSWQVQ